MKPKNMPNYNDLTNKIKYDFKTGNFYKKIKNTWCKTGFVDRNGYFIVKYKSIAYLAHRLAYYIYYKIDPQNLDIDHKNGNKLDNSILNLRLSTTSQNCCNQKKGLCNKSGYKGVCKNGYNWSAQIYLNGKKYYLGTYKTSFYAFVQYCKAAKKYHGEYKRFI